MEPDKRFGSLLVFIYHFCDRIAINGYLSGLSRPPHGSPYTFLKIRSNHHDIQD